MRMLVRLLASAVALAVAAWLVDGISVGPGTGTRRALTLLAVAVLLGLVNAVVRPVARLLSLPLLLLTLGLFTFVLNALMLLLTAWLARQLDLAFRVEGFWAALAGALVVTVVGFLLDLVLPDRYERRPDRRRAR